MNTEDKYISVNEFKKMLANLDVKGFTPAIKKGIEIALSDAVPQLLDDEPAADVQPVAEYNKWINAKEQKPEAYEDVLVLFEYYFCGGNTTKLKIGTAYYVKNGDKWLGDDLYVLPNTNVIYWQPKTAESGG